MRRSSRGSGSTRRCTNRGGWTPPGLTASPTGTRSRLAPLLAPRSVALVGASDRNAYALRADRLLREWSFSGPVHAVNPVEPSFQGLGTVPSLRDVRDVDLALVLVGRTAVVDVLRDAVD